MPTETPNTRQARSIRTLLVDDSDIALRTIGAFLRAQGGWFNIIAEARTAALAVELTRNLQPELILMDFYLPDSSGVDAAVRILHAKPDANIIVVTAMESESLRRLAVDRGAKALVGKQQIRAELMPTVARLFPGREFPDVPPSR